MGIKKLFTGAFLLRGISRSLKRIADALEEANRRNPNLERPYLTTDELMALPREDAGTFDHMTDEQSWEIERADAKAEQYR